MDGEYFVISTELAKKNAIKAIEAIDATTKDPIAVHIQRKGAGRTKMQNAYLWGWVYAQIVKALRDGGITIPLANGDTYPYDTEILHQIFKRKFLAIGTIIAKNGSELVTEKSTTSLTKKEFSAYCDDVEGFVWEFWNIRIPAPVGIFEHYKKETRA